MNVSGACLLVEIGSIRALGENVFELFFGLFMFRCSIAQLYMGAWPLLKRRPTVYIRDIADNPHILNFDHGTARRCAGADYQRLEASNLGHKLPFQWIMHDAA